MLNFLRQLMVRGADFYRLCDSFKRTLRILIQSVNLVVTDNDDADVVVVVVFVEASAPKVYPRVTLASASTLSGKDLDGR